MAATALNHSRDGTRRAQWRNALAALKIIGRAQLAGRGTTSVSICNHTTTPKPTHSQRFGARNYDCNFSGYNRNSRKHPIPLSFPPFQHARQRIRCACNYPLFIAPVCRGRITPRGRSRRSWGATRAGARNNPCLHHSPQFCSARRKVSLLVISRHAPPARGVSRKNDVQVRRAAARGDSPSILLSRKYF